jgi:hypothetical protein
MLNKKLEVRQNPPCMAYLRKRIPRAIKERERYARCDDAAFEKENFGRRAEVAKAQALL